MKKLLIIDLQKQFKDKNGKYEFILSNIYTIMNKYDIVFATVFSQIVDNIKNPNYIEKLNWNKCLDCSKSDLEFIIDDKNVIIKNGYGIKNIEEYFTMDDEIDIIGCCTDACIMAICFQLWDLGYNFNILSDYIYTTSSTTVNENAKHILKGNFGNCLK